MKSHSLFLSFMFVCFLSYAQNVQWAYRVLEYSSQRGAKEYAASQALGKPNVYPSNGEKVTAWQPKESSNEAFIKVGFLTPTKVKQIVIAETYHPGYIAKVFAYDAEGKEYLVKEFEPKANTESSRLLTVRTPDLDFFLLAVKVVLKPTKDVPVAIDAIGISESDQKVDVKLKESDLLKANLTIKKLGPGVNSPYPEFGPLLSPDGKTLYFSRRYDPANVGGAQDVEDIWYAQWDEKSGKWNEAKNMGIPLNNKEPNFINSISPDGNTVLLGNTYYKDGTMDDGVSISRRTLSGWSFPEKVNLNEENVNDKANFYLSNSQKVMLMSIERKKDTYGNRDLYASFPQDNGTWSTPLNLGNSINTAGTEAAPFLAADDKTLYFTSDGLSGYGGSDIYVTRRLDDTWKKWSEPENLGPIINSSFDESYFTISAAGDKIYFTSAGEKEGDYDMFTLTSLPKAIKPQPVVLVKGKVLNSKTNEALGGVNIFFENLETGVVTGIASSNPQNGDFQIVLPSGSKYGYLAHKPDFVSVNANLDLVDLKEYAEIKKDLLLTPIEVGQKVVLNNLFFDFGKSELRKESYLELNRLAELFKKNSALKIEISGHTDNVGAKSINDKLSADRAMAVVNYLVKRVEASKGRIREHHYGESQPVADNSSAKGRQLNRRVEFKILEK